MVECQFCGRVLFGMTYEEVRGHIEECASIDEEILHAYYDYRDSRLESEEEP